MDMHDIAFVNQFNQVALRHAAIMKAKGWDEKERSEGEEIALMHAELSEGLEALRYDNPPSKHIPEYSGVEEELADVILRIMHFSIKHGYRTGEALMAKLHFNMSRPHRHGGKAF